MRIWFRCKKIDVCKHDCALFWKESVNLQNCPVCSESRRKVDDGKGKKIPHKVLHHFPLKPGWQRLLKSRYTVSDMRWHNNKRVNDDLVQHPVDATAWKEFNRMHPLFSNDARNIRICLSLDGFNPCGNFSTSYSMWPIFLVIYNLPHGNAWRHII